MDWREYNLVWHHTMFNYQFVTAILKLTSVSNNIFIWSGSLFQVEKQKQRGLYVSFCTRHRYDAI